MQTHYKNLILFISISALFHLLTSNFLFESWLDWRAEQNVMDFFGDDDDVKLEVKR